MGEIKQMENIFIITTLLLLVILSLVVSAVVLAIRKKDKPLPWNRTPFQKLKLMLHQKPHVVASWDSIVYHELFPFDKRITIQVNPSTTIMPNSVICIGTEKEYDKFLITGPIYSWAPNVYTLDVLYLGPDSNKKGITITYN
jgi:hypothetical protein